LDNFVLEFLDVDTFLRQILPYYLEAPLTAPTESISAVHIFRTVLVKRIVGQVHVSVFKIVIIGLFIVLCAESSQSLLIKKADVRLY
jgi:hypothetical protein